MPPFVNRFCNLKNPYDKPKLTTRIVTAPSAADEIAGLDSEMGVSAYTEFELVRHNGS